ncbi:hypothetical protein DFH07DRAFT_800468 [Mycena maculata]|uniref:Nucleolus and neural progenitor protein-like N-terminal domain-containing protein n=1 Tax=Mycena maculata TaxID=230809 RepID=A0AAD7K109_9AGAR|nr:hypothetical protein DFH07DRAFT_800468 [Mycena maculata]
MPVSSFPRSRKPPRLTRAAKASLDQPLHSTIDAALKELKTCARRLQPVFATFSDELQILHRLYYKGKNQHRPALFWRRVAEMRRYGDRVQELSLLSLVDSLRYSFFGEDLQQNSKLLKGSWTHYPDPSSVSFALERIGGSLALVQKMHERLAHAYQSFVLAMQTGAFIQLILTLAGIASRMSSLVAELAEVLELIWAAVHRILLTLDPRARSTRRPISSPDQSNAIEMPKELPTDIYEDTGVSIARQDPQNARLPNPYTNTAHEDMHAHSVESVEVERKTVAKRVAVNEPERRRVKKKQKRDEIDDIFG